MGIQSCGSPNFENFGTPNLGVLGQNDIWVLALWSSIDNTIRGKVMASPSSSRGESCEFVFTRGSSVHQKCSDYALTNLLFGLCMSMWTIDLIVILPKPSSTPLYLQSVANHGACPNSQSFHCFHPLGLTIESIKEFWGASTPIYHIIDFCTHGFSWQYTSP
jgi:hypothetical protein